MYVKDLKKLSVKELKMLAAALKRSRDASQNIVDRTEGIVKYKGGRKELKGHLIFYEKQLNKVYKVLFEKNSLPPSISDRLPTRTLEKLAKRQKRRR